MSNQQAKKIISLLLSGKNVVLVGPSESGKTWFINNEVIPLLTAKKIKVGYFSDCNHISKKKISDYKYIIVDEVEVLKDQDYLESLHPNDAPYYTTNYLSKVNGWYSNLKKIRQSGLYVVTREKDAINNFINQINKLDWNKKKAIPVEFVTFYKRG